MRILAWAAGLAAIFLASAATAANVGFEMVSIPVAGDRPLRAGIWYPTQAPEASVQLDLYQQSVAANAPLAGSRLPLVVISHGTGGSLGEHHDTARALAEAGFVAAAVSHTGDTYDDHSRTLRITERPAQLSRLIDYVSQTWRGAAAVDPHRIGAFGFSAGGFTVLAAIGGKPDLELLGPHCAEHPKFYGCQLTRQYAATAPAVRAPVTSDPRIRAAVVVAPAMGFTFTREGLANVRAPVQLWRGEQDSVVPEPYYAEAVRQALPRPPEHHVVPGAGHFDFLAPCTPALAAAAPEICAGGFDRAAFHARFNAEVVRFFRTTLR